MHAVAVTESLTSLQRAVLELFFDLPESTGFVLAGGAALVATGLTERPTKDVDLFGSDLTTGIVIAADALEAACHNRGWTTQRLQDNSTFRRLVIEGLDDEVLVDLAVDSPPLGTLTITTVGPTYSLNELAARKLLALFDRAEARDFVDIHVLSERFDLDQLLELAARLDAGFTPTVLQDMLAYHRRFTDDELAELGGDPRKVRAFADEWRTQLAHSDP
jgi:hypothetical protein